MPEPEPEQQAPEFAYDDVEEEKIAARSADSGLEM